jgi:hypothetical protein
MAFYRLLFKSGQASARWKGLIGPAVILLAAAVAIFPQLPRGNSCGHDFDIHLLSWFEAQNGWRHAIPYPHWTESPNFVAGEPRFVFYPPLTWMLGAALGLVLPWTLVPIVLTFLLLAATGLATRALSHEMLTDGPATLAGCAALFSGYALFTAYERTAFGELTGGFWIPQILLFALRDHNTSSHLFKRALDGSTAPLALVVAGAWLSNAPVGVMGSYLLTAVALTAALLSKSWAPLVRAFAGTALGMGLAAIYLVPAVWEQHWADLRKATDYSLFQIENSWLFARHADPWLDFHDTVLHHASIIAIVMIAVALGGVLVSWLRGRLPGQRRWWIPLALIPVAVLFLQFPVSQPVWNALPKLRFLQFPWRWLVVLEAPMAIFFAAAAWCSRRWRQVAVLAACTAVFLAVTAVAGLVFFQYCETDDAVPSLLATYRSGAGVLGSDEYAPPGADNSMVAMGLPDACLSGDAGIQLGIAGAPDENPEWRVEQGSCDATATAQLREPEHLRIAMVTGHAGYLILRLRSYPAWRVNVNGLLITSLPKRADGLMAVPVPQGPVDLTVDWTTTVDVIAGRWLSGLALLLLTAMFLLERKLSRSRL